MNSTQEKILKSLQKSIKDELNYLMKKNDIGFNDLVKLLNITPAHLAALRSGSANPTISSIVRIFSVFGVYPKFEFKKNNITEELTMEKSIFDELLK